MCQMHLKYIEKFLNIKENKSNYSEDFENKMSSLNEEMDRILSEDL